MHGNLFLVSLSYLNYTMTSNVKAGFSVTDDRNIAW